MAVRGEAEKNSDRRPVRGAFAVRRWDAQLEGWGHCKDLPRGQASFEKSISRLLFSRNTWAVPRCFTKKVLAKHLGSAQVFRHT